MKRIYALAALLSLFGIADALYLTVEHVTGQSVRDLTETELLRGVVAPIRCSGGCRDSPERTRIPSRSGFGLLRGHPVL